MHPTVPVVSVENFFSCIGFLKWHLSLLNFITFLDLLNLVVLYNSGFLAVFRVSPAEIEVAQDGSLVAG